jgi:hypothetical protein
MDSNSGRNVSLTPVGWGLIGSEDLRLKPPGLLTVLDSIYIVNAEISISGELRKSGGRNEI